MRNFALKASQLDGEVDSHAADVLAVICIPTFRRPCGLLRVLHSIERQVAEFGLAVIVVDNDVEARQGLKIAKEFFLTSSLRGNVAIESKQGHCNAVNRAFELARNEYPSAEYFAMIDDDEWAEPRWIKELVTSAQLSGADIVGGPVLRTFEGKPRPGVANHPLFLSIVAPTGKVPIIHGSGNCLIRRRVFEKLSNPIFDPRFNFLGGGDMDFFVRCRKFAFEFYWNSDAIVHEVVPRERTSWKWLINRSIRTGVINYNIDRGERSNWLGSILLGAKNLATIPLVFSERRAFLLASVESCPRRIQFLYQLDEISLA